MSYFRLTIWDSVARAQQEIKAAILSFETRQKKSAEPIIGRTSEVKRSGHGPGRET
jgi:hypothetical protein